MGTNYYVVPNRPSIEEPVHIGKSSAGWMFLFHEVNEPYRDIPIIWWSYDGVMNWLEVHTVDKQEYVIINEYDEIVDFNDFKALVDEKQEAYKDNPGNFIYCKNVNGYRFTEGDFS